MLTFSLFTREGSCPQSQLQNGHSDSNSQHGSPREHGNSSSSDGGSPSSHGGTSLHVQDFVPHIARIAKLIESKVDYFWLKYILRTIDGRSNGHSIVDNIKKHILGLLKKNSHANLSSVQVGREIHPRPVVAGEPLLTTKYIDSLVDLGNFTKYI